MTVQELTREQLIELKVAYLFELDSEGTLSEVIYGDSEDDSRLSWGEIANADNLIPDDVIIEHYNGTAFVPEDFTVKRRFKKLCFPSKKYKKVFA